MTYLHQSYPKALYSPNGEMKIAKDEEEHRAIEAQWESQTGPNDDGSESDDGTPVRRGPGRPRKNP